MSDLMSISDARSNLPELVTKVSNTLGRVMITVNGKPKAILVSAKESIKQGLKEAKKGHGTSLSQL